MDAFSIRIEEPTPAKTRKAFEKACREQEVPAEILDAGISAIGGIPKIAKQPTLWVIEATGLVHGSSVQAVSNFSIHASNRLA